MHGMRPRAARAGRATPSWSPALHRPRPRDRAAPRRRGLPRLRDRARRRLARRRRRAAAAERGVELRGRRRSTSPTATASTRAVATVVERGGRHLRRWSTTAASACAAPSRTARDGGDPPGVRDERPRHDRASPRPSCRTCAPRGCGRIVTITSVGGRVPGFGVSIYCASKFAQEGLAEGARARARAVRDPVDHRRAGDDQDRRAGASTAATAARRERPGEPVPRARSGPARRWRTSIVERSPTTPGRRRRAPSHAALTDEQAAAALRRRAPRLASWSSCAATCRSGVFERLYFGGQLRRLERASRTARCRPRGRRAMSRDPVHLLAVHGARAAAAGIAAALRERGHEVAFYTGEAARGHVEGEGFEFFPFERARRGARVRRTCARSRRAARGRAGRRSRLLRRCCATGWSRRSRTRSPTCSASLARWQPRRDRDRPVACGARSSILWEAERIPVALSSTFMGPLIPGPDAPAGGPRAAAAAGPARRARCRGGVTRATEWPARGLRGRVDEIRARARPRADGRARSTRFTGRLPLYLVGSVRGARLRAPRPAAERALRRPLHLASAPSRAGDRVPGSTACRTDRPWVHVDREHAGVRRRRSCCAPPCAALAGTPRRGRS